MIEKWKDTAFGSDFGMTFLEFIEENFEKELSIRDIYNKTNIEKYIVNPKKLKERTDNNVYLIDADEIETIHYAEYFNYVHFEDLIIGLSAIIVESGINGKADLTKAYGNKSYIFKSEKSEIKSIYLALKDIYDNPKKYVLFEMMLEEETKETLKDIEEILIEFKKLI